MSFLNKEKFIVKRSSSIRQIDTYKLALQTAIDNITHPEMQKIFYNDFDRLIHWVNNYPDELINILNESLKYEYLHIGRTIRAFKTHPLTQTTTENIVNKVGSKVLKFKNTRDILSACSFFTKLLAQKIINVKTITDTGFYCTWPVLFWYLAKNKKYIEVDGQEWETPDKFEKEIKEIGFHNWLDQFQTNEEWEKRVDLLNDCLIELFHITKINMEI